jgi:exosortase/archaeosortase family protein
VCLGMSTVTSLPVRSWSVSPNFGLVTLLVGLFINAYLPVVMRSIGAHGFLGAISSTFGISSVAILAMCIVVAEVAKAPPLRFQSAEKAILYLLVFLIVLPLSVFSWLGVTVIAIYFYCKADSSIKYRSVSMIMFMLAFHAQWVKYFMAFFREHILFADAFMVASLLNLKQQGNLIYAMDNTSILQVLEACSSFNNLSIAFLGYSIVSMYSAKAPLFRRAAIILTVLLLVVLINTVRIGLIAWDLRLYDLVHGSVGAAAANWLSAIVIIAVPYIGLFRWSTAGKRVSKQDLR